LDQAEDNDSVIVFGSLAVMITQVTVDPMALRPQFSRGLPLSREICKGRNKKRTWHYQVRFDELKNDTVMSA
jgi:hypothetical protein